MSIQIFYEKHLDAWKEIIERQKKKKLNLYAHILALPNAGFASEAIKYTHSYGEDISLTTQPEAVNCHTLAEYNSTSFASNKIVGSVAFFMTSSTPGLNWPKL